MRRVSAFLALVTTCVGCFYSPPNPPVEFGGEADGPDPCQVGGGVGVGGRTVVVGLPDAVDPANAPIPSNSAEAFAFGHAFQTLVRLDCNGRITRGLALRWRSVDGGTRWRFELDPSATFWDGAPVMAPEVAASIRENANRTRRGIHPTLRGVQVTPVDSTTLEITLAIPAPTAGVFADPGFAVSANGQGTGLYILGSNAGGEPLLRARLDMLPDLLLRHASDARDLIDNRAEVLAVQEDRAARYARTRRDFQAYPLRWATRYVLLAHDGFPTLSMDGSSRRRLADEAVRAEARPVEGPSWWETIRRCPASSPGLSGGTPERAILYPETDPVARDLAQRIGVMVRRPARGVSIEQLENALFTGRAAAVYGMPLEFPSPCLVSAEWDQVLRAYRVLPLVDHRRQLVKAFLGPVAYASYHGGFEFRP